MSDNERDVRGRRTAEEAPSYYGTHPVKTETTVIEPRPQPRDWRFTAVCITCAIAAGVAAAGGHLGAEIAGVLGSIVVFSYLTHMFN